MSGWNREDYYRNKADYEKWRRRKPWETEAEQGAREAHQAKVFVGCLTWIVGPIVALTMIAFVVGAIENYFKFDTWNLDEKQQAIEQEISDEVDLDGGEAFTYDIYTDDGEDFRDEDVVARKYGYECFIVEHSSSPSDPYTRYECKTQW